MGEVGGGKRPGQKPRSDEEAQQPYIFVDLSPFVTKYMILLYIVVVQGLSLFVSLFVVLSLFVGRTKWLI